MIFSFPLGLNHQPDPWKWRLHVGSRWAQLQVTSRLPAGRSCTYSPQKGRWVSGRVDPAALYTTWITFRETHRAASWKSPSFGNLDTSLILDSISSSYFLLKCTHSKDTFKQTSNSCCLMLALNIRMEAVPPYLSFWIFRLVFLKVNQLVLK